MIKTANNSNGQSDLGKFESKIGLPSNEEAERVIIGSIFLDPNIVYDVMENVTEEMFYSPWLRRVFHEMTVIAAAPDMDFTIDPVMIYDRLRADPTPLPQSITFSMISTLIHGMVTVDLSQYYRLIAEKWKLRRMIHRLEALRLRALSEEYGYGEIVEFAENEIYALSSVDLRGSGLIRASTLTERSISLARQRGETGDVVIGLHTGFIDLDYRLQGLKRKDLIIVAARPSIGKTMLLSNILVNSSVRYGASCVFFSLEMGKEAIIDRMICAEAGINASLFKTGHLDGSGWDLADMARSRIDGAELFIDDTAGIGLNYMRARLRRQVAYLNSINKTLDLIAVDYLQLMSGDSWSESRQVEVGKISSGLKGIAKEFDCPVMALSQLSRNPENRSNHKPGMSDLRESGTIEQDADVVAFIYREDVYRDDPILFDHRAEVIIGKNRNGPTGTANLKFHGEMVRFENLAYDHQIVEGEY